MRGIVLVASLVVTGCSGGSTAFLPPPSAPETTIVSMPLEIMTEATAVFQFDSNQAGVAYRVWLDQTLLGNEMANPLVLENLTDGTHTIHVAAVSVAGLRDKSPVSVTWTVDTKAPVLTVTFPPPRSFTDTGSVAVCGTLVEDGGLKALLVNGVHASSTDGFKTWRAIVPVHATTTILVEVWDVADRTDVDATRVIAPVDPPPPPPESVTRDEFELLIDDAAGEAIVVEATCVTAIDLATGARRTVSDAQTGTGAPFKDIVVMNAIPGTNDITVFDTNQCRLFTVDLASGDRTVIWNQLGQSDIPATREGLIASDGKRAYVQGPRQGNLVALDLDGSNRVTIASTGWVYDAVALTWDGARDRLLAVDAITGHVYAVDPTDGSKQVLSAHDTDFPVGYERGLVIDGDRAFTIARDRNGILEIDLDSGDRKFLAMSGDGLEDPRAIALHEEENALVVLDHGRAGLMYIDLDSGNCREKAFAHSPRPECAGPIYCDPKTGELCLLDGGRCALVAIDCGTGTQRTIADLSGDAPDAIDFHMNPATGEPIVLERHAIYEYEDGCTTCRKVPLDPDAPLGAGLALRVESAGETALVLDSRPHTIDLGWQRYTIRKDCLVRVDLATGKCTLVKMQPAAEISEIAAPTGAVFLDEPNGRMYVGAVECTNPDGCYHPTVRALDLTTNAAESVWGVREANATTTWFVGGSADTRDDFGAIVRDPVRNELHTLDRVNQTVGRIHFEQVHPRYEVFSGDMPLYKNGAWTTVPHGHGPSLDGARGMALDADAGLLFVTKQDRVIAVDVRTGDRVVVAILR